ncbi:MAG: hypothetical protein SVX43_16810 [Cyanobacteriota bacterium]|nr:hypothetical protein [Cyanobacteriota bacterium]
MGRQARLKKRRHAPEAQSHTAPPPDPKQFVKEFQQQGYNLKQAVRSPDLPDNNPEPEV